MAELSALELTAGAAVMSAGISIFAAFNPDISKVFNDLTGGCRDEVDFGQQVSAITSVAVGAVLSIATRSVIPLMWSIGIAFGVSFIYEMAYRHGLEDND